MATPTSPMTPEQWRRIEEIYHRALELPESERRKYLRQTCEGDEPLLRQVESLLSQKEGDQSFLRPLNEASQSWIGRHIGPLKVISLLGTGGMGEVYLAKDTRLERDVAIKVLSPRLCHEPEHLKRFRREAQVLASLNHPNIAAIYGLEDAGGVPCVVMELVPGETLADRLARGRMNLNEAFPIAIQITEAVETAHDNGIIHRDLKPANIKVTPEGKVKVLDFGLAKPLIDRDDQITNLTSGIQTCEGTIAGTPAYMSPEQMRGKQVDKGTDVWAFGCVLFEMISGCRAFPGETTSDITAAILGPDPDWAVLPANTPPLIRRLLRRSLAKDRRQRLGDISTARLDILEAMAKLKGSKLPPTPRSGRWPLATALAIGTIAGGLAVGLLLLRSTERPAPRVIRMAIPPAVGQTLRSDFGDRLIAISPDGSRVAYNVIGGPQSNRIFMRTMDQLEPMELSGLGTPRHPFFSPDGAWLGIMDSENELKKVSVKGGPPVLLCQLDSAPRRATWGSDGTIIFATSDISTGLWRVPESGGTPALVTRPNAENGERDHLWPRFLPGGQAVLFTIIPTTGATANRQVAVLDLRTGTYKILISGASDAVYTSSGHLIYGAAGTLRAVRFDLNRLEVVGEAIPVVQQAVTIDGGPSEFDISNDGALAYLSGKVSAPERTLVWVDRQGREEPLRIPARQWEQPLLSPDGTAVALESLDREDDIWLWDLARETLTNFTTDPTPDGTPVWAPDGRHIFYASYRSGVFNLYRKATNGVGEPELLVQSLTNQYPTSVSPDGTRLVFTDLATNDVMMLDLNNHRVQPLVQTKFAERNGVISPDGKWMAYESNESGQSEVYVRPFPDVNSGKWLVSSAGGARARWSRNGKELFYVAPPGALMTVKIDPVGSVWNAGKPETIFDGRYYYGAPPRLTAEYDVSLDGMRFLMNKPAVEVVPPTLVVVENWIHELRQHLPQGRN